MVKTLSTICIVLFAFIIAKAQVDYSGIIQDERGERMIFASILSVEELKGWQTNFDGEFEFNAPKDLEVYITYAGYERVKTILKSRDTITMKAVEDDGRIYQSPFQYLSHYSAIRNPLFFPKDEFQKNKIENYKINSVASLVKGKYYHSLEFLENSLFHDTEFNTLELKFETRNPYHKLVVNNLETDEVLIFNEFISIDALPFGIYDVFYLSDKELILDDHENATIHTQQRSLGAIIKTR